MKRLIILTSLLISCLTTHAYEYNEIIGQNTMNPVLKGGVKEVIVKERPLTGIGVVGIQYIHAKGYPTYVKNVYPNSPASRAGLQPSDLIYSINGLQTPNLSSDNIYNLLSGAPGTPIHFLVSRDNTKYNASLVRVDLATFSTVEQNRYLSGPVAIPFDAKDIYGY